MPRKIAQMKWSCGFFWKTYWVAVFLFFVLFIMLELAVAILTKIPVISNKWLWRFRKKCSSQNPVFIFKNASNLIIILKLHVTIFSKVPVSWTWDAHLKFVTWKSIQWQLTLTGYVWFNRFLDTLRHCQQISGLFHWHHYYVLFWNDLTFFLNVNSTTRFLHYVNLLRL